MKTKKEKVWSAIRADDNGTVDDVAISGDLFRLERMDSNTFWVAVYRDNKRVCFVLQAKRKIVCTVTEEEIGCADDTPKHS